MTNRNMPSTTRNGNTSLGRVGSSVLQSNASVFQPAMSKKHAKEAENELHVGGLRRPIQSLYMVPGWEGDWTQALGLHRRIALRRRECVLAHPFVRVQADFPRSTVGIGRESAKCNFKGVCFGTSRNDQAALRVAQHCPCRHLVRCYAGGQRPRCRHYPGLVGTRCAAGHGQRDNNHRRFPAGRQTRQGRRLTNPRCVRATYCWRRTLQIRARKPRRMHARNSTGTGQPKSQWTSTRPPSNALFPKGHINKLGLIIKESPEKRKVRLVVDMRRSRANARAAVPERPILPRPCDVVADWKELFLEAVSLGFTSKTDVVCENVTCDFSDAYCHVLVHPDELKNCLVAAPPSPSGSDQEIAMMCRMGFGSKGAPLTWCRIAAALGRAAQAVERRSVVWTRNNTYIDDPLLNLLGTQEQRDKQLQAVLLFWTAVGFKVAWAKGTRSKVAKWIGLEFTPDFQSQTVTVRIPAKTAEAFKQDAQKLLSAPMIPLKMLRQLAGKGGWIMNLLPKARWTIQRLWGAIAEEERRRCSLAAGTERRPTRGGMRTHLVARRQA